MAEQHLNALHPQTDIVFTEHARTQVLLITNHRFNFNQCYGPDFFIVRRISGKTKLDLTSQYTSTLKFSDDVPQFILHLFAREFACQHQAVQWHQRRSRTLPKQRTSCG